MADHRFDVNGNLIWLMAGGVKVYIHDVRRQASEGNPLAKSVIELIDNSPIIDDKETT